MRILLKIPLLLLILFTQRVNAEQQDVTIDFTLMLWAPFDTLGPGAERPKEPMLSYLSPEGLVSVRAVWNTPTDTYRYSGDRVATFFIADSSSAGTSDVTPAFSVTMPHNTKHVLLVVFSKEGGGYYGFPIDIGLNKMAYNNVMLINYCGEDLVAKIGNNKTHMINNKHSWTLPVDDLDNFQLKVQLAKQDNEQWRLIYRSSIPLNDDSRTILFIHKKNIVSGPIRVRPISRFGNSDLELLPDLDLSEVDMSN